MTENGVQLRSHVGDDVGSVDNNPVSHKAMSLVGGEQVNAWPIFMQRGKSFQNRHPERSGQPHR